MSASASPQRAAPIRDPLREPEFASNQRPAVGNHGQLVREIGQGRDQGQGTAPAALSRRGYVAASRASSSLTQLADRHLWSQAAPPKTKYIEHILVATHAGEAGVGEVFRALQYRLRDSTWTVVFKSLVTVHLMIREGSPDVTLAYLAKHKNMLAVSVFSDGQS